VLITHQQATMPRQRIFATQNIRDDRGHRITTEWKTVSISHMLEFGDIEPSHNGGKKRGK